MSNYTAEYETGDTSKVVIDLIVAIGAGLVSFGTLIGLILLYNWVKKRVK